MASGYRGQEGPPLMHVVGARAPHSQGVTGSPGGNLSPPPTHGSLSPGPHSHSFAPLGTGGLSAGGLGAGPGSSPSGHAGPGGPGSSPGLAGPAGAGSFQVPGAASFNAPTGTSFQVSGAAGFNPPTASSSFQGPGTASYTGPAANGSFQAQTASGSFTAATGSFTNVSLRLPTQQNSFNLPGGHGGSGGGLGGGPAGTVLLGGGGLSASPARSPGKTYDDPASTAGGATRPLKLGSYFGPSAHGPPGSKAECQDQQCAEEECDPEECGDENRAPRDDNFTCGIDRRPLLPVLLVTSTLTGAMHNMILEFPMLRDMFAGAVCIRAFFLFLYAITMGCMAYCILNDPGQLNREERREAYDRLQQGAGEAYAKLQQGADEAGSSGDASMEDDPPLPKRCHKAWLYGSPIRRYDHFCRWLTNCIGLLNHREFFLMVWGLVMIGVCGGFLDFCLVIAAFRMGRTRTEIFFLALHLAYSAGLTSLAGPIFRLHVGFVSRNELANEWKRNDFYVVTSLRTGKRVPVNELSDDEFNERFDAFEYDESRNPWDKGTVANCWAFWCTPRRTPGQLGEF